MSVKNQVCNEEKTQLLIRELNYRNIYCGDIITVEGGGKQSVKKHKKKSGTLS